MQSCGSGVVRKRTGKLKVAVIGEDGVTIDDILVHDATEVDPILHLALINMQLPDFPVALGVIRSVPALIYNTEMVKQIKEVQQKRKNSCVDDLLNSGNTWEVEGNEPVVSECPELEFKL